MATRAQKTKVGIFLVVCFAILAGGFLVISGYKSGSQTPYYILFDESILGLNRGGLVEYNGVPVGKVSDIGVAEDRNVRVDIQVEDEEITVYKGVKAQLVMYSIATGTMAVSLSGGDAAAGKLEPRSEIPSKPSLFASTAGSVPEILKQVSEIGAKIDTGLEGIKEGQLTKMLEDADGAITDFREVLEETTTSLKEIRSRTNEGVEDVRGLIKDIRTEVRKFTEKTQELIESTNRTMTTMNEKVEPLDLAKTEQELQDTLRSVRDLAESAKEMTEQLDTVTKTAVYQIDNVEHSVNQTMAALTETLDALRALAVVLKEDPSAIVYGPAKPEGR
ncbi:MAG: MlaD family protein [Candidatus Hydrogenedentota bacterium]